MSEEKTYERFNIARRIEHFILVISFFILGLTGLVQMFSHWGISKWTISILGGIELIRIVHRVSAAILMFETIYHLVDAGYKVYVLRQDTSMLPSMKDIRDGIQAFLHNIGVSIEAPKMKRYNFTEKAEYWAMVWGFLIMGVTGFMLWNPIITVKFLPGEIIPAAKAAHGGEALLAVLAIILWHFYSVHIRSWNWSMVTGKFSREEMEEEHFLELEAIEAGTNEANVTEAGLQMRKMIYYPVAGVVSTVMLVGIYVFLTIEETSLTTIPPLEEHVAIYVPQTPTPIPTRTSTPVAKATEVAVVSSEEQTGVSWDDTIAEIFAESCQSCHGTMGGFSVEGYAEIIEGGDSGPVIIPGNSGESLLVQQQQEGEHMGQLLPDDLDLVIQWIDAGALGIAGEVTTAPAAEGPTWQEDVQNLFADKCLACHGTMGGLSFQFYASSIEGGSNGPVIISGDAEGSLLVELMNEGGHAAQFAPEELDMIISWINEGAPEFGIAISTEAGGMNWQTGIKNLFTASCLSCHGEKPEITPGGVSFEDYETTIESGNNGPVVLPGDAEGSPLVLLQREGGHVGQFTEEELDMIISWIDGGALKE